MVAESRIILDAISTETMIAESRIKLAYSVIGRLVSGTSGTARLIVYFSRIMFGTICVE